MIVIKIIGGLGNQMFQYAASRALALERGQSLRLDISNFADYGLHQGFELQRVFACQTEIATEADIQCILGWQSMPIIRRFLARHGMASFRRDGFVVEPHFHYWPEIKYVPQDAYLAGYWQSERYFRDVASTIRNDFAFKLPLAGRNAEFAEQIEQVNAVSLHVRRGDYVKNPKTNATHGLCSLDYYQRAIEYVSGQVEQPHFFIFSNDIAWVKNNLKLSFPCQYVDYNQGMESYNDMRLMSLCRHHIIANSTFSWWGAWLSRHPEKQVLYPGQWFATGAKNISSLCPVEWIRIDGGLGGP